MRFAFLLLGFIVVLALPDPAVAGGCCIDDLCSDLDQAECGAQLGEYHGDLSTCETISCTSGVALFREYNPANPPTILTDPRVRYICLAPYPDPDTPPAGTTLTFYRINNQGAPPDPGFDGMRVNRIGSQPVLIWPGADCSQGSACCLPGDECILVRDQLHCQGSYQGDGSDCASVNCGAVTTGACCESLGNCMEVEPANCLGIYQGDDTFCADFACTGACCQPDGSCVEVTADPDCQALNGDFQGDGTDCITTNCNPPVGACCDPLGGCTEETEDDCNLANGSYQGDGTDCAGTNCQDIPGACCEGVGNCTEVLEADCVGTFNGFGTLCADYACSGACCLPDGTCSDEASQADCTAIPGQWFGDGSDCATTNCQQPVGACCASDGSGNCSDELEPDCLARGDVWLGLGTDCASSNCTTVPGACCRGVGNCGEVPENACSGHFFGIGSSCASVACSGACCLPDESCSTEASVGDCQALSGDWRGDGSDCGVEDCALPRGACCDGFGGCSIETEPDCIAANGFYRGDGTDCAGAECDNVPGACCTGLGNCVEVLQNDCTGTYQGPGSSCANFACSGPCCLPDESCVLTIDEPDCLAQNGEFQGDGLLCGDVDCAIVTGACCQPGMVCTNETESDCIALGGDYQGDGTDCATTDCP